MRRQEHLRPTRRAQLPGSGNRCVASRRQRRLDRQSVAARTDRLGFPVLELDENGNLKESDGRGAASPRAPLANFPSLERLAAKVAIWIEWTAIEPGEFRKRDIHPDIRDRVTSIAEEFICDEIELTRPAGEEVPPGYRDNPAVCVVISLAECSTNQCSSSL